MPLTDVNESSIPAAAEPLRIISTRIEASANAAQIFAQHRVALEILEGEVATEIVLSTRHSIANAWSAPAFARTDGSHVRRARRTWLPGFEAGEISKGTISEEA
ncbi:MAG: hypothetical protein WCD12_11370 [Candidatus Binatus sp.]|uniref:hypothetical protein n=1 Tax=Candidatus Binatus sp. TaxID=2811406 RepID=UPI003C77D803